MKTTPTLTLTSMPVSSNYNAVDRTADEEARARREADRARLRRMQGETRRHADAETRLADAMARASARTAQLARPSRVVPEIPALLATANAEDIEAAAVAAAQAAKSVARAEDEELAARLAAEARETLAVLPDPADALLQRLGQGLSRGLVQDCAPILESLAAQWTNRALAPPAVASRDRESLESALEFLQAYADASAGRLAGAERLAKLVVQLRQQLQAAGADAASPPTVTVLASAGQQIAAQSPGKGQPTRNGKEKEPANAVRKVRRGSDDEASEDEGKLETAGAAAVAAHAGGDQGKVATVSESSLDKDQRKRRDDTLPLVTLRSI